MLVTRIQTSPSRKAKKPTGPSRQATTSTIAAQASQFGSTPAPFAVLEGGFQGDAREVDDRVDAPYGLAEGLLVGEVGGDRVRFAFDGAYVEEAQLVAVRREELPHQGADATGGAGEQNGAGSGHPRVSLHRDLCT
jgi:hypothetical protein